MRYILDGMRPKKPIFIITRGYTKELWEMTTSCWEEDPAKRPSVEYILDVLSSAAERWEPKCGELATQDDTEESDSEHEDEPDITSASTTINSPRPPVIEAPPPLDPIPAPSVLPDGAPPKYIPVTPLKKGEVKPAPVGPSNEEELKSTLAISRREEIKPAFVSPSEVVREEPKLTPVTTKKEEGREEVPATRDLRNTTPPMNKSIPPIVSKPVTTTASGPPETPAPTPAPLIPTSTPSASMHSATSNEVLLKSVPVNSLKKDEVKPPPVRPPGQEEPRSTPAISGREEMKLAPARPSKEVAREEQKLAPVISKKERTREDVPTARSHQNTTHLTDESILPLVSKPVTTASASVNHPQQSSVIETPIRAPVPLAPTLTPSVSMRSTVKDEAPPKSISTTSSKREVRPPPTHPPKEEPRLTPTTSKEKVREGAAPTYPEGGRDRDPTYLSTKSGTAKGGAR